MALRKAEGSAVGATLADGKQQPAERHWWRYLLVFLLIPLLFYPFAFLIATSANYEHWATSQWGPVLEYAYNTAPQDADVVIFGDSAAFIGIAPRLLNARFGVHSLILPDSIGSIPVTGDAPLRTYLAHNRAPRLLVLYFAPWDLDFGHYADGRRFEGEEMLLRHGSGREILDFTLHHPTEMLVFPFRLYSTFGPKMIRAALHHTNREQDAAEALGHADYNGVFPALESGCELPAEDVERTGTSSVAELVRRYNTPQTQVLVYLAPVPGCAGSGVVAGRAYPALQAAAPRVLPPHFFAADPDYAHILPAYVPQATDAFARSLAPTLEALHLGTVTTAAAR